jgi:hypothetical protein
MDESDRMLLAHIEEFGCHVISVSYPSDEHLQFTYSVGIQKSSGAPEVIVIGLKRELAAAIVNDYNKQVQAGARFSTNKLYEGFLEGFFVCFSLVPKTQYHDHFGSNLWLYKNDSFDVLQLIWPSTSGVWPWEPEATPWLRKNQPILGAQPLVANEA